MAVRHFCDWCDTKIENYDTHHIFKLQEMNGTDPTLGSSPDELCHYCMKDIERLRDSKKAGRKIR